MRRMIFFTSIFCLFLTLAFGGSLANADGVGRGAKSPPLPPPPTAIVVTVQDTTSQGGQSAGGGAPGPVGNDDAPPVGGGVGDAGPAPVPADTQGPQLYYGGKGFGGPRPSWYLIMDGERATPGKTSPAAGSPGPAPVAGTDPIVIVRQAIVGLGIPAPTPHIGPDPAWNKWNAAAVNFPYWLWTDHVDEPSLTQTVLGQNVRLAAHWDSVSFDMGDGHSIDCADTSIYVRDQVKPASPSPLCGYRYPDKGDYTITATHHWLIDWTIGARSGQVRMDRSAALPPITVAEFESVVTG